MQNNFFPFDPEAAKKSIVDILYQRLYDIKMKSSQPCKDEFDRGINFRLCEEERWLVQLLDQVERS